MAILDEPMMYIIELFRDLWMTNDNGKLEPAAAAEGDAVR